MTCGIYLITCRPPNALPRYYVGQSINVERRLAHHKSNLRHGRHHNKRLLACWEKYGPESFTFEILEVCDVASLNSAEAWWLSETIGHERVLNTATEPGGYFNRGAKFSAEHKEKLSLAHTGKPKGSMPSEVKAKISAIHKGRPKSEGFGAALSERQRGESNPMFGRRGSNHPGARAVVGVCLKTGRTVRFSAIKEGEAHGFLSSKISQCCNGSRVRHKGYAWSFEAVKA